MSEHTEQVHLFRRVAYNLGNYPELKLLHAIPNGGLRNKRVAIKLKQEGVKSGVPDICLPVARKEFHGLYIEMKVKPNKPTENQKQWLKDLEEQGYKTAVCYSSDEAWELLENYLEK